MLGMWSHSTHLVNGSSLLTRLSSRGISPVAVQPGDERSGANQDDYQLAAPPTAAERERQDVGRGRERPHSRGGAAHGRQPEPRGRAARDRASDALPQIARVRGGGAGVRGRIRQLKPDVFFDEELWALIQAHPDQHILQSFEGLWVNADREGRFQWRPAMLKSQILPYWGGDFERSMGLLRSEERRVGSEIGRA